jgi:uncharacterized membrane protein YphA (DoxX/SURF4 family)
MSKKQFAVEVVVFLFIVLFLYAAGVKLVDYKVFVSQIAASPLATRYASVLAWLVPAVEVVLAILLMIPRFRLVALYGSFGLMMTFTFYIITMFSISTDLPCACGGVLSKLSWKEHLIFNIGYDLLGLTAILLTDRPSLGEIPVEMDLGRASGV